MSHICEVRSEITNLDVAKRAAANMGLAVMEHAKPRYWGTRYAGQESKDCDLVIILPGEYDLGLKQEADGRFSFVCDNELLSGGSYGQNSPGRKLIGENGELFMTEYARAQVELELMAQGIDYQVERTESGEYVFTLPDPSDAGYLSASWI